MNSPETRWNRLWAEARRHPAPEQSVDLPPGFATRLARATPSGVVADPLADWSLGLGAACLCALLLVALLPEPRPAPPPPEAKPFYNLMGFPEP